MEKSVGAKRARSEERESDVIVLLLTSVDGDMYCYVAAVDEFTEEQIDVLNMSIPKSRGGRVHGVFQCGTPNEAVWKPIAQDDLPALRSVRRVVTAFFDS